MKHCWIWQRQICKLGLINDVMEDVGVGISLSPDPAVSEI